MALLSKFRIHLLCMSFLIVGLPITHAQQTPTIVGELRRWHPMQISFQGEFACENWNGAWDSADFNPFLHRRLTVIFENGDTTYLVPGFFNGNGSTAFTNEKPPSQECGNVWSVRFTPDEVGTWTYRVDYRQGRDAALSLQSIVGVTGGLHGIQGSFVVAETDKTGDDFRAKGILRYVGGHYARFDNGEYYLKTGTDSPENFMGYYEFHNTFDHEIRDDLVGPFIHTYSTHANDYNMNPGILWGANQDKGRNIYGALNYLKSVGVNSVYMINYGIDGGDGGDVWAWSCPNQLEPECDENKLTFDMSKLDQWALVFQHMSFSGIQIHFVFSELENYDELTTEQQALYYREMIARFAHNHAVIWNLGEENLLSDSDKKQAAAYISALDPYDHRITVHTTSDDAPTFYDGLLGDPNFDATSIQHNTRDYNELAIDFRQLSTDAGQKWILYFDEQSDPVQEDLSNWSTLRAQGLWGNFMGGGAGIQWYVEYQSDVFGDINLSNFRLLEEVYQDAAIAREFMEMYVPNYWTLEPINEVIRTTDGEAYAFGTPGSFYALYVEDIQETNELDLRSYPGLFQVGWYSPRTGQYQQGAQPLVGGKWAQIEAPPFTEAAEFVGDSAVDYALVVTPDTSTAAIDVTNDGRITPADAMYVINRVGGGDLTADVNGDNVVNNTDVQIVYDDIGKIVPAN